MADDNGIYHYKPSRTGAVIFAGLFGISAAFHLLQMVRSRAWFYSPFTVGAIMMTAGYASRYISAQSPAEIGPYIAQSLFIILPPSLYAATIYMIYGRLVLFVNAAEASVIAPTRVTKIFVCGDVLAFLLQAGGGGLMAQANLGGLGQKVMLTGLFIQLLFFGFFLVISLIFYKRTRSSPARFDTPQYGKHAWPMLLHLMFCAAAVIILRCTFRIVEFAQGEAGYLASHEIYMYLCDTLPMLGVQVMFHFVRASSVFGVESLGKLGDQDSSIDLHTR